MPSPPTTPRPLDTLWQASTIIWIILAGEALAVVLVLAPGGPPDWLAYFGMASFAIQWVFLTSLGGLYLCRRWLDRAPPPFIAQAGLAALLLSTWLICLMAWLFLDDLGVRPAEGWFRFSLQLTGLALTVGLLALAAFQAQWRGRQLALRAKQSELEALQARVRPHFLFNTLNSGIALVRQHPEQAEELLLGLSDLFRAALARPHDVALGEELALVRRYLEIEAVRFGPRLRVAWQLPEPLPEMEVPALSVQALVENAVRHGIERLPDGGEVGIEVTRHADAVVIAVRNPVPAGADGGGEGHSIGLQATRARLQASTGGRGSLTSGREGDAFVARIRLPVV
ncbi:sensor histidine kinase [Luteimonas lutimaris]|uniref:Sensor histidine kinase n=1 Tax=Luteimonas lutimaris TaxID=698645 RepID=A0ABP7MXG0_9GAMM